MSRDIAGSAPTSMATTKETEPEVVAGIASGDLHPDQKLSIRTGERKFGYGRMAVLLAAGLVLGYGAARCLRNGT